MPYKCQERMNIYIGKWRTARKRKAISLLGGKCKKCGSKKQLEFDHIDPDNKLTNVSKIWTSSEKKFWEEVKKCQLLCNKCHKIKTKEENKNRVYKPSTLIGEKSNLSKLKEKQVLEIRKLYTMGKISSRKLGKKFNVSKSNILAIVSRKTWSHI